MYSLYRAWLSLNPNLAPLPAPPLINPTPLNAVQNSPLNLSAIVAPSSPASTSSAVHHQQQQHHQQHHHHHQQFNGSPDVLLQVGPTLIEFSAHRTVLAAHSGFFKAALIGHSGPTPISVPNVNVDEFSSLLTFMYTGYLDLNLNNIYNTLLATHILHMPKALELCRNFLTAQTTNEPAKLIKPIASRKNAIPNQEIFHPINGFNLKKSEETVFKSVGNRSNFDEEQTPSTSKQTNPNETIIKRSKLKKSEKNDRVIVDVACCDGPVKFHRVLNKNYGNIVNVNIENEYRADVNINKNAAMNKVMNENINQNRRQDENGKSNEVFTCLYCNHTFKSQYCYQKHARRHLNPVSLDIATKTNETNKREVKLLDMNVQYYPCKTCGSKFPSYYFVHKHRKLCHAEEMADNTNKNNEIVMENNLSNNVHNNNSSDDGSSKNSVIDVVEMEENK